MKFAFAAAAGPPPGPPPDEIFRAFLRVLEKLLPALADGAPPAAAAREKP